MKHLDIIRAWKDPEYRNSLSAEQLSQLPEHPAGMSTLSDEALELAAGGLRATTDPGSGCGTGTGTGTNNPNCCE